MSVILHILEGFYWSLMLPIEAIRRLFRDDKAISPVLGLLLMVVIVVALGALVAIVVWNMTDFTGLKETANTIYQLP